MNNCSNCNKIETIIFVQRCTLVSLTTRSFCFLKLFHGRPKSQSEVAISLSRLMELSSSCWRLSFMTTFCKIAHFRKILFFQNNFRSHRRRSPGAAEAQNEPRAHQNKHGSTLYDFVMILKLLFWKLRTSLTSVVLLRVLKNRVVRSLRRILRLQPQQTE